MPSSSIFFIRLASVNLAGGWVKCWLEFISLTFKSSLIFIDGKIPRKGSVLRVYAFLCFMALPVGLISWITGGNYMFLMQRPDVSNPIVFGEWPWYILNISFIGLFIMTIAYLPFKLIKGLRVKNWKITHFSLLG